MTPDSHPSASAGNFQLKAPAAAELAILRSAIAELGAAALGLWTLRDGSLDQLAFVPGPTLPEATATEFAAATRSVPLDERSLGIIAAVLQAATFVANADDLDPNAGSGYWLRRLGATRSVAVPIVLSGRVLGVLSLALTERDLAVDRVESLVNTLVPLLVESSSDVEASIQGLDEPGRRSENV